MTDEAKLNSEAGLHNIICQNVTFISVFHHIIKLEFKYFYSIFNLNSTITENHYKTSYFI